MFVKDNSLVSVQQYFAVELKNVFTDREIKQLTKQFICKRLGWDAMDYLVNRDATVSESDLLYFRSVIKQLLKGEPYQYVLGEVFFYNLTLNIDRRALIPRPETEELVDWVLSDNPDSNGVIVDIGTGSGCIPLALKRAQPSFHIYGVDKSLEALSLAQENSQRLDLAVEFLEMDILTLNESNNLPSIIDVIVSNPPYILEEDKVEMSAHVLDHEPHQALFVTDNDPLQFYKAIADFALKTLRPSGKIYLEIHENYAQEVVDLYRSVGFQSVEVRQDLQGKDRMIKITQQLEK